MRNCWEIPKEHDLRRYRLERPVYDAQSQHYYDIVEIDRPLVTSDPITIWGRDGLKIQLLLTVKQTLRSNEQLLRDHLHAHLTEAPAYEFN